MVVVSHSISARLGRRGRPSSRIFRFNNLEDRLVELRGNISHKFDCNRLGNSRETREHIGVWRIGPSALRAGGRGRAAGRHRILADSGALKYTDT